MWSSHMATISWSGEEARGEIFDRIFSYSASKGGSESIHPPFSHSILSSHGSRLASRYFSSTNPHIEFHTHYSYLTGPYVYSLYKDQFGLPETVVAALFTTGFLSGGISAYFVGQFADRYGRKIACLVFCVTYSFSCFSTLVPLVPVLFLGRVLGGLSTSLMFSAFESWMVTEYHKRHLDKAGTSLSSMFGIMTTLNSVVAILAGVSSEWLVQITHTKRAPFMASAGLLIVAFWIILGCWVSRNTCPSLFEIYTYNLRPRTMAIVTNRTHLHHHARLPHHPKMRSRSCSRINVS